MPNGDTGMRMRMRSISLEDLRSIVKRMISRAIDDTEQMKKVHRAIYEELYFEKIAELEKAESIERNANCTVIDPCNNNSDDSDINKINNESISIIRNLKENKNEKKNETKSQSKRNLEEDTERNERAFENWKKAKTRSMRKLLKEERKKKRIELEARRVEIEKKRASHEAYLCSKNKKKSRLQFTESPSPANADAGLAIRNYDSERIIANEEAFEAWKRRKDNQSCRRFYQLPKQRMQIKNSMRLNEIEFDSWLDRLDSVLHQKYLRERRYLVRSFYCQPTYYGTAALSIQ